MDAGDEDGPTPSVVHVMDIYRRRRLRQQQEQGRAATLTAAAALLPNATDEDAMTATPLGTT